MWVVRSQGLLVATVFLAVAMMPVSSGETDCGDTEPVVGTLTHDGFADGWGWSDKDYVFSASAARPDGGPITWTWHLDGTEVSTDETLSIALTPDPHTVTLIVTADAPECGDPATTTALSFTAYDPSGFIVDVEGLTRGESCGRQFEGPDLRPVPALYIQSCHWSVLFHVPTLAQAGLRGDILVDGASHLSQQGKWLDGTVTTEGIEPGEHVFEACFHYPDDTHGVRFCESPYRFVTV